MSVAVVALGALAVWAAIVTQNHAHELSRAGVQTSGHLRAVQALSLLDTSSDELEEELVPGELAKLRKAQRVLDNALLRMENGGVRQAGWIADQAKPIVARLKTATRRFLTRPAGSGGEATTAAEEGLEESITELQVLLNDLDADPSALLASKLDAATDSERTVRATAFALLPIGLVSVAACAWMLSLYRRRSEATMLSALESTAQEARTDELTGLPNRRALLEELEARIDAGDAFTLTLADLNGFKRYNDTFGHPAGDALLRRLGLTLAAACEGRGIAARLGGDEFCVLFFAEGDVVADTQALVTEALSESGEGFHITSACGEAAVPDEARSSAAALRVADTRMYAAKVRAHPGTEEALSGAMTRMLDEHHPGLGTHVLEVSALAGICAEALGLSADEVRLVARAAELHDVGKVAIPSAILTKQSGLGDEDWDFVRRHSIIGERILTGVPSLQR
ncbi:MAG TPA: diguanylate cyclase, partial [Thermoleophilaceae bacterium]|nr:diguanylate cyclase [Thermoleophilaceae bacterium]